MTKIKDKPTRVVVLSDLHSGHRAGMTPPKWWMKQDDVVADRWTIMQQAMWGWYKRVIAALQPIDILIGNGDLIDGKGGKSEGVELITSDRNIQAKMAAETLKLARAKKYRLLRGTNYHGGPGESFEDQVAASLSCPIGNHEWFDINGLIFDVKHHVNGGNLPHTKGNAVQTDMLWNIMWSVDNTHPKGDVFVRSHLHTSHDVAGPLPYQRGIITPGLQGPGSRFGELECRKRIDIGLISFDIKNKMEWTWTKHLMDLQFLAVSAERL